MTIDVFNRRSNNRDSSSQEFELNHYKKELDFLLIQKLFSFNIKTLIETFNKSIISQDQVEDPVL